MLKHFKTVLFFSVLSLFFGTCRTSDEQDFTSARLISTSNLIEIRELPEYDGFGFEKESYLVKELRIKTNDSFYVIMRGLGVSPQDIFELQNRAEKIFPLKSIQPNQKYFVYYDVETKEPCHLIFQRTALDYVVFSWMDGITVSEGKKELRKELATASGVIKTSLFDALVEQNVNILAANRLSEIFGWQIDFFRLYAGDEFKLIYEKQFIDDQPYGIGDILAAQFFHQGKHYSAFYYANSSQSGYFDEKGNSVQKALLKAPFTYSQRISSGFSHNRFHPVTKENQPHYGIDYAAPLNTPVIAAGDGEVLEAQYRGVNGNIVRIKHNSIYTTAYLHLNGFAKGVRKGATVKQGQVIGYVGRTGRVTGVHLDYRVYKNDKPVNPLTLELPPAEGVAEEYMAGFKAYISQLMQEMNDLGDSDNDIAVVL